MTDAELITTCRDFRGGLLGEGKSGLGMCAVVCLPLSSFLSAVCSVKAECFICDHADHPTSPSLNHVWMELADGRVLDPTFDQFCSDEPVDIYLGPPTEFHQNGRPFR